MGNTAWITGRATTMRALTTLAQFSLLAFSCQALKITDNCSSGAQCSQELNGFRGAESVQNCQGAQCDIDFGRQPSQGRPQNNQQGFNRDRPQNNRPTFNQGSRPNNNQPGRVTITDNCSSGAQCSQNLNGVYNREGVVARAGVYNAYPTNFYGAGVYGAYPYTQYSQFQQ